MLIRKTYYDDRISDELLQKRLVESKLFAAKIMLMQINAESGLTDCSENPIIALKTDYSTREFCALQAEMKSCEEAPPPDAPLKTLIF